MTTALADAPTQDLNDVHVVLRTSGFVANGIQRERGEVVVTKDWRTAGAMVRQRYLGAADYDLNETMVSCECGRFWVDAAAAESHTCPARKG